MWVHCRDMFILEYLHTLINKLTSLEQMEMYHRNVGLWLKNWILLYQFPVKNWIIQKCRRENQKLSIMLDRFQIEHHQNAYMTFIMEILVHHAIMQILQHLWSNNLTQHFTYYFLSAVYGDIYVNYWLLPDWSR